MEENWPQLLNAHGPSVWRLLRCLVGNEADARDCYQTVFLEAFRYSQNHTINEWEKLLKRIARTRAIDLLRQRYRTAARFDRATDPNQIVSRIPNPLETTEAVELAEQLRIGLALLPEKQSETFVMRFVEQLSYDEIANRTNSNRNGVGVLLNRARIQLREFLESVYNTTSHDIPIHDSISLETVERLPEEKS